MDELDDILNSGDVTLSRGSSFQGESDDEFDATALLSEPLFVDGDDVDNLTEDVILDLDPDGGPPSNNANYQDPSNNQYQGYPSMPDSQSSSMQSSYQQHEQQQEPQRRPPMRGLRPPPSFMSQNQQQQQQNQFSSSYSGGMDNQNSSYETGGIDHSNSMDSSMQSSHQQPPPPPSGVDLRMMEVQQKIQQVQQQIHQVQFQGASPILGHKNSNSSDDDNSSMMMNPNNMGQQQQQQQQQNDLQSPRQQMMRGGGGGGGGNMAGMTRTPPGRSISMPAQRMMNLPTSPFSNSFVMQQQQNTLQAMSQSQGMNPNFYNNNNNNEGGGMMNQNNNPMMNNPNQMMNSQNPMMNNNQGGMNVSMNSHQGGGMNQSMNSHTGGGMNQNQMMNQNNQGMMNQSLSNNSYSDHGGQQPPHHMMDLSSRSVPAEIGTTPDPSMSLAMMQQATMPGSVRNNSLPMRNNSLPRTGSGNPSMPGGGGGGGFDLSLMAQSYAASQGAGGPGGQPSNVNEAMEKLCESMRRSAMSRTLVKQLSGRTPINRAGSGMGMSMNRAGSGRGVERANSGRQRDLVRANSGRQISRAHSGKAIQRSHSGAQQFLLSTGGNDGTPELQPIRRMSQDPTKRMVPSRGVFRNHSTTAVMGMHDLAAMQQFQQQQQQALGHSSLHNINHNPNNLNMNDGSGHHPNF